MEDMRMNPIARGALLLLAAVGLLACDTPTDPSAERVTFTYSPEPAVAERSRGKFYVVEGDSSDEPDQTLEYDWTSTFTVTVNEESDTALDINGVTVRVQQATGGIITPPTRGTEYYEYVSQALDGSHIAAKGQAGLRFQVWYDLPSLQPEAVVTISFTFTDQDEVSFSDQVQVRVQ
jgi:hypothetical protein